LKRRLRLRRNPHRLRRHLKKRRSEKLENRRPRWSCHGGTDAASPTFCSADRNATAPEPLRGWQIPHARESAVLSSWLSEPREFARFSEKVQRGHVERCNSRARVSGDVGNDPRVSQVGCRRFRGGICPDEAVRGQPYS